MSGPCHLRVFDGHGCVDIGPHAGSGGDALDLFLREAQEHLLQGGLHQGVLLDGVRLAGLLELLEDLAQAQAARAEPRQLVQVARVVRLEEPGLGGQRALDELADLCRGPQVLLVVLRTLPEADLHLVPRPVLQLQVNRGAEAPEAPEHLDADAVDTASASSIEWVVMMTDLDLARILMACHSSRLAPAAEPRQLVQVARVMRLEEPGLGRQRALDELADLWRRPQVLLLVPRALLEADLHLVPGPILHL
eukprot:CAMPEP_0175270658 /NCGR_PEP_ID=MMETSP0093-20121207/45498_1 /TAXON_ID=311494 /ORGANISM="Alexandrium monilatum, Strain CCMP3105" /LENGTH=249 /DNA_ID=CAMNT_0016565373 /DNA_START=146 /DNA_END=893 /DNA_ORIENTATION=-